MWSFNKDLSRALFIGRRESVTGDGAIRLITYRLALSRVSAKRYACERPLNPLDSHPALEWLRAHGIHYDTAQETNKRNHRLGHRETVTILEFSDADLIAFRFLASR